MTVKLTLRRLTFSPDSPTLGVLLQGNKPLCVTVERPWMGNARNVSCIPPGVYRCVPHSGAKFKDVWRLEGVPGRDAILIHAGNRASDVQGCIAVGRAFHGDAITDSQATLAELRKALPDSFDIEVVNP